METNGLEWRRPAKLVGEGDGDCNLATDYSLLEMKDALLDRTLAMVEEWLTEDIGGRLRLQLYDARHYLALLRLEIAKLKAQ